jgi:hypothetical protein
MDAQSLTLDSLSTIAGIVVGCLTLGVTIAIAMAKAANNLRGSITAQIDSVRAESAEGRRRVYERLDQLEGEIRTTYVRADVYAADQRALSHAIEEAQRIATLGRQPLAGALNQQGR